LRELKRVVIDELLDDHMIKIPPSEQQPQGAITLGALRDFVTCTADATKAVMTKIELEVRGSDMIVTLPGASYTVTYCKPKDLPQLVAKRISRTDDPRVGMRKSEFLAEAWRRANDKARELGWIV
jgi:hypothetical protein